MWLPIALNFAACSEEREVMNLRIERAVVVYVKVSLSWEKVLWPILNTGWSWFHDAEWEVLTVLFWLDSCGGHSAAI